MVAVNHRVAGSSLATGAESVPLETSGEVAKWVVDVPLPGNERTPARPVKARAGGPRAVVNEGPVACGKPLVARAGTGQVGAAQGESGCVPLVEHVGQACGPKARAARRRRPRICEQLELARRYRAMLDAGLARSQSELARKEGVTRARMSQVLALLGLAPRVLAAIDALAGDEGELHLTERALRGVVKLPVSEQWAAFAGIVRRR